MATSSVYLRPVNGRNRPHDWHAWSPTQQLEFLLGMSLDDISEIMFWPIRELDSFCPSVRMQVTRIVFMIGVKALLDGRIGCEPARDRIRDVDDGSVERQFNSCASSR
jgi:hypothetical protein